MAQDQRHPHAGSGVHHAVATALTMFEHAVRRHAAAQTELRISRRASTSKQALKTSQEIAEARQALTQQLEQLGWQPPADISLDDAGMVAPRTGD